MRNTSTIAAQPGWTAVLMDREGLTLYRRVIAWKQGTRGMIPLILTPSFNYAMPFNPIAVIAPDGGAEEYDGEDSWPSRAELEKHVDRIAEGRRERVKLRHR